MTSTEWRREHARICMRQRELEDDLYESFYHSKCNSSRSLALPLGDLWDAVKKSSQEVEEWEVRCWNLADAISTNEGVRDMITELLAGLAEITQSTDELEPCCEASADGSDIARATSPRRVKHTDPVVNEAKRRIADWRNIRVQEQAAQLQAAMEARKTLAELEFAQRRRLENKKLDVLKYREAKNREEHQKQLEERALQRKRDHEIAERARQRVSERIAKEEMQRVVEALTASVVSGAVKSLRTERRAVRPRSANDADDSNGFKNVKSKLFEETTSLKLRRELMQHQRTEQAAQNSSTRPTSATPIEAIPVRQIPKWRR